MLTDFIATPSVFLDTSYAIALASQRDIFNQQARVLAQEIAEKSITLITTQAILLEIGNALANPRYRHKAIHLLAALAADNAVKIIPLTTLLYQQAFELFTKHSDKSWGITDCISFVVMREYKLTEALTADHHFQQAGFRPLLSKDSL